MFAVYGVYLDLKVFDCILTGAALNRVAVDLAWMAFLLSVKGLIPSVLAVARDGSLVFKPPIFAEFVFVYSVCDECAPFPISISTSYF